MSASTIDAETLRRATLTAERLNATSNDEDVLLVAGVLIQLLAHTTTSVPECEHVWRFAHVLKRGLQSYRVYYCQRCLTERESRVFR